MQSPKWKGQQFNKKTEPDEKELNKANVDFQIFPSTCCPCLQTKHAHGKHQALILSHLIGQSGSCMDKMCPSRVTLQNEKNQPHFQNDVDHCIFPSFNDGKIIK